MLVVISAYAFLSQDDRKVPLIGINGRHANACVSIDATDDKATDVMFS